MVDNRGFMVTRSYTVGVTMMHRTGRCLARQAAEVGVQGYLGPGPPCAQCPVCSFLRPVQLL